MSRAHDMGGRFGDGPVPIDRDDRVFHEDWHARAMALTVLSAAHGAWNIDASRHARETITPRDYTRFGYYERWMAGLADLLVARGLVREAELVNGAAPAPMAATTLRAEAIPASQSLRVPYTRDGGAPRFAPGDAVRTLNHSPNQAVPGGHTRLPRYAMGRVGQITRYHGAHVLPDSNAHFLGEAPEPLYAVTFTATELWGSGAEAAGDMMVLDLWESYLMPADG